MGENEISNIESELYMANNYIKDLEDLLYRTAMLLVGVSRRATHNKEQLKEIADILKEFSILNINGNK